MLLLHFRTATIYESHIPEQIKKSNVKELLKTNIYYVHGEIYFTWAVRSYPAGTACISESSLVKVQGRVIQSWVKVRTTTMKFEFRYESSKSKFTLIFFVSSL